MRPKKKKPAKRGTSAAAAHETSARVREEPAEAITVSAAASRITIDPNVMGGKPCIRGMRVTVGTILALLAKGHSRAKVLKLYPYLEREDIDAALRYGAKKADENGVENGHRLSRLSRIAQSWGGKFTLPKSDPDDPRRDYLLKKYWRHRK